MSSQPRLYLPTPTEYLAAERRATTRSEYHDGEIVAMVGASREHNLIVTAAVRELDTQLRGRPCETYSTDMRVRIAARNIYTYPDLVVVCGEPHFEDAAVDTLLNPTLIIEVLSPSTEQYDRGDKFAHYRTIPGLVEYLLIAQHRPHLEYHRRDPDNRWSATAAQGRDATLALTVGGGCTLALADLYERITFPT